MIFLYMAVSFGVIRRSRIRLNPYFPAAAAFALIEVKAASAPPQGVVNK